MRRHKAALDENPSQLFERGWGLATGDLIDDTKFRGAGAINGLVTCSRR